MSFTLSPSETRALYRYLTVGVDALSASEMDLVVLLNIRLKKAFEEKPHWRRDCEPLSKRLTSWKTTVEKQKKLLKGGLDA